MSNQKDLLKPVRLPESSPIYCLICIVGTVREQLQQAKQGMPEIEMMVTRPNLAITWGPANINGQERVVPLCAIPEHLGVSA